MPAYVNRCENMTCAGNVLTCSAMAVMVVYTIYHLRALCLQHYI